MMLLLLMVALNCLAIKVLPNQLQKYLKKCKQIFWRQQDVLKAKQRLYTACITFWKLLKMCILSLRKIHLGIVGLCMMNDIICLPCLLSSCTEITGFTWKGTTASWNWFSTSLPQFLSWRMLWLSPLAVVLKEQSSWNETCPRPHPCCQCYPPALLLPRYPLKEAVPHSL